MAMEPMRRLQGIPVPASSTPLRSRPFALPTVQTQPDPDPSILEQTDSNVQAESSTQDRNYLSRLSLGASEAPPPVSSQLHQKGEFAHRVGQGMPQVSMNSALLQMRRTSSPLPSTEAPSPDGLLQVNEASQIRSLEQAGIQRQDMDGGVPASQPQDAGESLPGGVPRSQLSQDLEQVWHTQGKGAFFERLRHLSEVERRDPNVNEFVTNHLVGDDRWLAQNLLTYGAEAHWPVPLRVERAMKGWGDSGGASEVIAILGTASGAERQQVLNNVAVMTLLRSRLNAAELLQVATSLANVTAVPAGPIRDATVQLILSAEEVDRNTALRLINGDIAAYYMEDLQQPPNVDAVVTAAGLDPTLFTVYLEPPQNTQQMFVQRNAQGFKRSGTSKIFGLRSLTVARWQTLLVHETNHARNPDTSDTTATQVVDRYRSEFRAYWVAEFRTVANLDERARQIKTHVLNAYPRIKAFYDTDATVRAAIDAHTRPDGNVTNQ